jgi:hypothetical protein
MGRYHRRFIRRRILRKNGNHLKVRIKNKKAKRRRRDQRRINGLV